MIGLEKVNDEIEKVVIKSYDKGKAEVKDKFSNGIKELPTYFYGVSMLSAEEYIKKSDLIDMLEQI